MGTVFSLASLRIPCTCMKEHRASPIGPCFTFGEMLPDSAMRGFFRCAWEDCLYCDALPDRFCVRHPSQSIRDLPSHAYRHRFKLNPFTLKMLTIDRWFDISRAKKDLKYEPLYTFEQGWTKTIDWFKAHRDWIVGQAEVTGKVSEGKKAKIYAAKEE